MHVSAHLARFSALAGRPVLLGELGEHVTLRAVPGEKAPVERAVAIGAVLKMGTVLPQVGEPRTPCWKPAGALGGPNLLPTIVAEGRTGFFDRLRAEGFVSLGEEDWLVERPYPEWPLPLVLEAIFGPADDARLQTLRRRLHALPELAEELRRRFRRSCRSRLAPASLRGRSREERKKTRDPPKNVRRGDAQRRLVSPAGNA